MEAARDGGSRGGDWDLLRGTGNGNGLLEDMQLDPTFLNADFSGLINTFDGHDSLLDPTHDVLDSLDLGPLPDAAAASGSADLTALLEPRSVDGNAAFLGHHSPTTSESGNHGAHGSGGHSSSGGVRVVPNACQPQEQPPRGEEDEHKRMARMQRNRENAHLSRQRKKQHMEELNRQCVDLRGQNTQLTCLVHRLVAENCLLRHHLGATCTQAGIPVPDVPSAMKSPAAQAARGPGGPAIGTAQQPLPARLPMQGVPAAAAVPQRPPSPPLPFGVPAPPAAHSSEGDAHPPPAAAPPAAATRTRKRARTATTATGAAFLALFSVFLFAAPFAPATLPAAGTTTRSSLPALPALQGAQLHRAAGRSLLQSLPSPGLATVPPAAQLGTMMNATLKALLMDPANKQLPESALRRLEELAPVAVLLDGEDSRVGADGMKAKGAGANPLAASNAFPLLAGQLFQAAGLQAPQTCQKVFEFKATSLPNAARSRRSVERYLMGEHGFKGRSLTLPDVAKGSTVTARTVPSGQGAVLMPSHSLLREEQREWRQRQAEAAHPELVRITDSDVGAGDADDAQDAPLPAVVDEPLLVSVLLPANASHGDGVGGAKLTAVDRVFVVLLHPQDRYVTYSCGLPRPFLV